MKQLSVVSLYPYDMNIYGDRGNLFALQHRARGHGYELNITEVNQGDEFPHQVDLVVGGGGQDSGQLRVADDLAMRRGALTSLTAAGTPMLMICGMYQLFGHRFLTHTGDEISGIGILDVETLATTERMIGNVVLQSADFGEIIGYENHSGHTRLGPQAKPLGTVVVGAGNNPTDGHEGARSENVIGSYLHGSLLPKNPRITDFLLQAAAERRYGSFEPQVLDESIIDRARASAKKRPR